MAGLADDFPGFTVDDCLQLGLVLFSEQSCTTGEYIPTQNRLTL